MTREDWAAGIRARRDYESKLLSAAEERGTGEWWREVAYGPAMLLLDEVEQDVTCPD